MRALWCCFEETCVIVGCIHTPGFPPYLKNLEFCYFFSTSRPGKCLQCAQKVVKTWILCFYVSSFTFQDVIYKNNFDLLLCHIYIINTNTDSKPKWPWISLLLPGNNLENTWNVVSEEKWEPCICFNTFWDFYNYNLYESTWNLAQKNLKKIEFRIKNLEKTWNLVFWKQVGTLIHTNIKDKIHCKILFLSHIF